MKKYIMFAVMAVAAMTASAQSKLRITPHVGVAYTNCSNSYDYNYNVKSNFGNGIGFLAGAEAEYMVTDKVGVSLGADFLYSKSDEEKVSTYDERTGVNISTGDMYVTQSYINIPILAQYHFGSFAVKAGLQPTLNLAFDFHKAGGKVSMTDNVNKFTLALPVGVSYEFKSPVVLDLRCAIPLTKLNKDNIKGDNNKLTVVSLTAGYRF